MSWILNALFADHVPHVGAVLTVECAVALICAVSSKPPTGLSAARIPL